ncbi:hypothetical protein B0H11DRAFT_2378888 [Mycena galericulata]|nr:hypothetical protein B0H11DRAFT_2378888 [Mycena galericulata]
MSLHQQIFKIKTPTINGVIDGWFVDATSDLFPSAPVFRSPTIALASSVSSCLASKTPQLLPSLKTPFILPQASPSSLQTPPPNLSASSPSFKTSPGLNTLYPKLLPSASYFSSPPACRLPTIADHVYCHTSRPLYPRGVGFTFEGYALFLVPLRAPLQHPHLFTQVVDDVQREVDDSINTAGDEATKAGSTMDPFAPSAHIQLVAGPVPAGHRTCLYSTASVEYAELSGLWLNNQGSNRNFEQTVLLRIALAITSESSMENVLNGLRLIRPGLPGTASLEYGELLGLWLNNQGSNWKSEQTVLLRIVLAITSESGTEN